MSLESILEHIHNSAAAEKEKILEYARQEAKKILSEANQEAVSMYESIARKEKITLTKHRQKQSVNARLEVKMALLNAKQELLAYVFQELKSWIGKDKLKKERILFERTEEASEEIDFYINQLRQEFELQAAKILFEA